MQPTPTRSITTGLLTALTLVLLVVTIPIAAADPPATTDAANADHGAQWLADQVGPEGFVPGFDTSPAVSSTLQTALALAAAGTEEPTFLSIVDWLDDDIDLVVQSAGVDSPGQLGYLLLVLDAADVDPTTFGGVDLVARLQATQQPSGLYGSADPTFDGTFRQSLAILGLAGHGVAVPASATDWLIDQQCDDTAPANAEGGWQSHRVDTAVPCTSPDSVFFSGPDTNSTALAIQALAAVSISPTFDALEFLDGTQSADAGFPFITGSGTDPNSTALVLQALRAAGSDPDAAPWLEAGAGPIDALLGFQIGCDGAEADIGAFASPFSSGFPDQFASQQAVWGLAPNAFPYGTVTFAAASAPCPDPTATTTTTTTLVGSSSTSTTTPLAPPAPIVPGQPDFTG